MNKRDLVVVCGAGGFIGGHLVKHLINEGYQNIRCIDYRPFSEWQQFFHELDNQVKDLRLLSDCYLGLQNAKSVFNLCAVPIYFQNDSKGDLLSILINTHLLMASRDLGVKSFFFASSNQVYPIELVNSSTVGNQNQTLNIMPASRAGLEKFFSEQMCFQFQSDFGLEVKIARYFNIFGTNDHFNGREDQRVLYSICRDIVNAKATDSATVDIYENKSRVLNLLFVDDCINASLLLMNSRVNEPVNIGNHQLITVAELVDMLMDIAEVNLPRSYYQSNRGDEVLAAQSIDNLNTLLWRPSETLHDGLLKTYQWIEQDIVASGMFISRELRTSQKPWTLIA
jgi:nucleoside-diphosphate-sugar epimerase